MVQANTRDVPRSELIPVPTGFEPEGINVSALDPAALALVEQAIPPNLGGRDLFVHLLYYATLSPKTTMQQSLFKETGDPQDKAIILITKVEDLAQSKGSRWSVETYHKVLLVLEALGVIRRRFHRKYTEIRIPLDKRANCVPACGSINSAKGNQHPSMLSPSSWMATTLPHVQKYLKTRETAEEVDS